MSKLRIILLMCLASSFALAGGGGPPPEENVAICMLQKDWYTTKRDDTFKNCVNYADRNKMLKSVSVGGGKYDYQWNVSEADLERCAKDSSFCRSQGYRFYHCKNIKSMDSIHQNYGSKTIAVKLDSCWEMTKYDPPPKPTPPVVVKPPEPEKPVTPQVGGKIIIKETFASAKNNVITTKVSGENLKVTVTDTYQTPRKLKCWIQKGGANTNVVSNQPSGFTYSAQLEYSGVYTMKCETDLGKDDDKKLYESVSVPISVVPAKYKITATIKEGMNTFATDKDVTLSSDGSTISKRLAGPTGKNEKVILRLGTSLEFVIEGEAYTSKGIIDTGANGTMFKTLKHDILGDCRRGKQNPLNQAAIVNGKIQGSIKFDFNDVYDGKLSEIKFYDVSAYERVQSDSNSGACNGKGLGSGKCPLPPVFEYAFDYLALPEKFGIKIERPTGGDITKMVFYYGQGNNPRAENSFTLRLQALGKDDSPLQNFENGCVARDLDMKFTSPDDISITFIDKNNIAAAVPNLTHVAANSFAKGSDSQAILDRVLSVKKGNGLPFQPNEVREPSYITEFDKLIYYHTKNDHTKEEPSAYPTHIPDIKAEIVILRGRINAIDADNAQNYGAMPATKVYYEFYCLTCDINKVKTATGMPGNYSPSPTLPGWWINSTFNFFNSSSIKKNNIETSGGLQVSSVSPTVNGGVQTINYSSAAKNKYQIKINQATNDPNNPGVFPSFLLFNPFYNGNAANWGTSAYVTVYENIKASDRDFGVDTGNAKNTRSGGRTGGF